jgi:phage anti-repressor protein
MGYTRIDTVQKHIKRNFDEDTDYKILKNKEYIKFLEKDEKIKGRHMAELKSYLPKPTEGPAARSKRHLIVMPDAFRSLCMMINTNKGKQIRKYYITLEKLIKAYNLYQTIFRCQEAERAMNYKSDKIDELKQMIIDNEAKADAARAKADEQIRLQQVRFNQLMDRTSDIHAEVVEGRKDIKKLGNERVALTNVPNFKQHVCVIMKDLDDIGWYYCIRSQKKSITRAIKKLKKDYGQNQIEVKRFEHGCPVSLVNEIYEILSSHITRGKSNWLKLNNINEAVFLKKFTKIYNNRTNPKY